MATPGECCYFASLYVAFGFLNTSSHTTPHLLLPLPTIWPLQGCHSQLHFRLKFKCFWAFQHLSLLFLICKNTGGPKGPSAERRPSHLRTGHAIAKPHPLLEYKLSTTHIPTKTATNLLLFMTRKWRICVATLDVTKRHYTTDDSLLQRTC